jgi:hypothetical protein
LRITKVTILFIAGLLLLWGCSTTYHAPIATQAYHDITNHYNAYFNVNEKLKGTLITAEMARKDNFKEVLPVYSYNDPKDFASYSSDLEDCIKRSTESIQMHKPANWVDDHLILIGRAYYYKGDYDKAASSFKLITTEYKEGVDYRKVLERKGKKKGGKPVPSRYIKLQKNKKKKDKTPEVKIVKNDDGTKTLVKEDNRPEFSLWWHEPARAEALIWLINTYTRQGRFAEASSVLTYTKSDELFYKNLDPKLRLAEADLFVAKKDYAAAIDPLEKYLNDKKIRKKKKQRVRPHFVLAQCYEATGNFKQAVDNYKMVLRSRPNYDMEFYAKLKMAKIGRKNSGNSSEIRGLLARMAKDGKYRDYYDQIYYEHALISLDENNRPQARIFLHKSVDNSTTNDEQKAVSYLKLAELDYEDEQYVSSKFFYDSTMTFMAKNDSRYNPIEERDHILEKLVTQLQIIANEDSLQKLAKLPKNELEKKAKAAIAAKQREEEDKKQEAENAKNQGGNDAFSKTDPNKNQAQQGQQTSGSQWYFYNTTARSAGYNDFTRKWGRRKLEDNWRRKNKSSVIGDDETATGPAVDTVAKQEKKEEETFASEEDRWLSAVPTTPEKLEKSNRRIVEAYYAAATIYKDELENLRKAAQTFETVNQKYPDHHLLLESLYNLYLIALKQKQDNRANGYKEQILAKFPNSVIAKVLSNPDFVNESKKKDLAINNYYSDAYNDYSTGQYESAIYKIKMSDSQFKPNTLRPKFDLLYAMVLSKQNKLQEYVQELNKIIAKTSDPEVKDKAQYLLSALNKSPLPQWDLSADTTNLLRDSLNAKFLLKGTEVEKPGLPFGPTKVDNNKPANATDTAVTKPVVKKEEPKTTPAPVDTVGKKTSPKPGPVLGGDTTKPSAPATPVVPEEEFPYKVSPEQPHFFAVFIKDAAVTQPNISAVLAKIDAFNSTNYTAKKLTTKQILVDAKGTRMINSRQFKNKDEAIIYFNDIKKQTHLFSELKPEQFEIALISSPNFGTFLSTKDVAQYIRFFNINYK